VGKIDFRDLRMGAGETGFFYENTKVAAGILGKKPGFFVGVRPGLILLNNWSSKKMMLL
jgi:hypothetical protein